VSFTALREVSLQLNRLSQKHVTAQRRYMEVFRTNFHPKPVNKLELKFIYAPKQSVTVIELIFTKLKLSGRFFVKDSKFKFHENPRKGLEAEAMSQKDGRTNVVFT